jgi:hypothetical protein
MPTNTAAQTTCWLEANYSHGMMYGQDILIGCESGPNFLAVSSQRYIQEHSCVQSMQRIQEVRYVRASVVQRGVVQRESTVCLHAVCSTAVARLLSLCMCHEYSSQNSGATSKPDCGHSLDAESSTGI